MATNKRIEADEECVWIAIGDIAAGIFAMTNARNFRAANENEKGAMQLTATPPQRLPIREEKPADDPRQAVADRE